jgi:hypothetical protein
MKKIVTGISFTLLAFSSHAGLLSLTHGSIANCNGLNQTVSWYKNHPFWAELRSNHNPAGNMDHDAYYTHTITAPKINSDKIALGHTIVEDPDMGNYSLLGTHIVYEKNKVKATLLTGARDCSEYDGWNK